LGLASAPALTCPKASACNRIFCGYRFCGYRSNARRIDARNAPNRQRNQQRQAGPKAVQTHGRRLAFHVCQPVQLETMAHGLSLRWQGKDPVAWLIPAIGLEGCPHQAGRSQGAVGFLRRSEPAKAKGQNPHGHFHGKRP